MKSHVKTVTKQYLMLELAKDITVEAGEFARLLWDLEDTQAYGQMVLVDSPLREYLEKQGIIRTVVGGASYIGDDAKVRRLLKKVNRMIDEFSEAHR